MNVLVLLASPERLAPPEAAALSAGLALPGAPLVVAAAGGTKAAPGLLAALAAGAPRAVLVADPLLAKGAPLGPARALAHLARKLGVELVLLAAGADEEGLDLLPAAVAHHLEAPYLGHVEGVECATPGSICAVVRSAGRRWRVDVPTPAVLALSGPHRTAAAHPSERLEPPEGVAVEVLALAELGLDPALLPRSNDWLGRLVTKERKPKTVGSPAELEALLAAPRR